MTKQYLISIQSKYQNVSLYYQKSVPLKKSRTISLIALHESLTHACTKRRQKNKPWISEATLKLERRIAVQENNHPRNRESGLNKAVRPTYENMSKHGSMKGRPLRKRQASRGNSMVLFKFSRALTNQRLTISDNIKDANGKVILGKSEKQDGLITLTISARCSSPT